MRNKAIMPSSSPASLLFLLLFATLSSLPLGAEASAAEATASPAGASATSKSSNSLRLDNESRGCKKAKKAYAMTKRKRLSTPLEINRDRRAVLAACSAAP